MNIKSMASLALTLIATSGLALAEPEKKCGAGSCSKKTQSADADKKDASCSKKDASCSKKDAAEDKKEASCSKKDASCSKKDSAETK